MKDIKILVACHKDDIYIPDNDLLYPIQVGSALAPRRFEGMLHDDEGDNISEKNKYYCELTALYWAWKNLKADYVGLFHYRRYLSFADKKFESNYFGDVIFDYNDEDTLAKIGLDESKMRAVIESYDVILPEKGSFVDGLSIREQYYAAWQHRDEDLVEACKIIEENYPHMVKAMNSYLDGTSGYFCNMFIMKKPIFDAYCEWLFSILEEHEKRRDYSSYDPTTYRVSGYLAERLFGIYILFLQETSSYSFHELQRPFFGSVSKQKLLEPRFPNDEKAVSVVFSSDDFYVPYLSALLESVKCHADPKRNYDLIVMHDGITPRNQRILKDQIEDTNLSLRFFDTKYYMHDRSDGLALRGHFKIETYFRLLLQDVLPEWDKVLYLDSDMIVLRDVAELFDEDIEGYLLAATRDADTAGLYNGWEPGKKQYMDEVLKIKEPYGYFQAGTILFNLKEFRASYSVDELFEFASSYSWELLDQDVLNYFAQGRVKYVPMCWNVMMDWRGIRIKEIIGRAPHDMYGEYMKAHNDPAVCHYAGPDKPWNVFDSDLAEHFWRYSRLSPYYEIVLDRALRSEKKRSLLWRIKDAIWRKLYYSVYEKMFPAHTKAREKMGYLYRKLRGRW